VMAGAPCHVVFWWPARLLGRGLHRPHVHQAGIEVPAAPVVATGAVAAVIVIARVFHGRDPAVRLRRGALQDLQLRGRHRLVLRALGTPIPAVDPGQRLLLEIPQEERGKPLSPPPEPPPGKPPRPPPPTPRAT